MKLRSAILIIALIIIVDQALKIWIKTSYPLGEVTRVFGSGEGRDFNGFKLYFVENPGMAWGMRFWGENGKLILTVFRLLAVIFGSWYLKRIVQQKYSRGFIICASLIYAGALGNLIDSMFYGVLFDKGMIYNTAFKDYMDYLYLGVGVIEGMIDVLPANSLLAFCKNNVTLSYDTYNLIANNFTKSDMLNTLRSTETMFDVANSVIFNCYYSAWSAVDPNTYNSVFGGTTILMNILYGIGFMYTDVRGILGLADSVSEYWRKIGKYGGDIIMRIFYRKSLTK